MIIVDLDNNVVTISEENPLPTVPKGCMTNLKKHLKRTVFPQLRQLGKVTLSTERKTSQELLQLEQKNIEDIRLCFLAFFVFLFRDIKRYLNVELEDTVDVFDIDFFLNTQITSYEVNISFFFFFLFYFFFEIYFLLKGILVACFTH